MLGNLFFMTGTLTLSLNFVRFGGLAISDWFYFASLALAILSTLLKDKDNRFVWTRNRLIPFALVILIGALLSMVNATSLDLAFIEIIQQIYTLTLFVSLIWLMVKRGQVETIITAFILSGVFSTGIALWDFATGDRLGPLFSNTLDSNLWYRYAGTLGHPNKFGYFLVLTSLLTLVRLAIPVASFWKRFVWLIVLVVQLFGVYLSGSVTAYIGLLVGGVAFLWADKPLHRFLGRVGCALSLPVSILVIAVILFNSGISDIADEEFIIERSLDRVQTITAESRLLVYDQAIRQIARSPIIGASYDQLSTSGIEKYLRSFDTTVHNILLQIWYAGGLFAFLGWLAIYIYLLSLVVIIFRQSPNDTLKLIELGLAVGVLSILIMDQFQDSIYPREKWLVIGLFLGLVWDIKPQ
jgi:O-antigen ligase